MWDSLKYASGNLTKGEVNYRMKYSFDLLNESDCVLQNFEIMACVNVNFFVVN